MKHRTGMAHSPGRPHAPHTCDQPTIDSHGLAGDLSRLTDLQSRRRTLRWLSLAAAPLPLVACGGGDSDPAPTTTAGTVTAPNTTTGTTTGSLTAGCVVINEETQGPYPADGSNAAGGGGPPGTPGASTTQASSGGTVSALAISGIVRQDITTSLTGTGATAAGVPLTIELTLVNANSSCASLAGYAIYIWHCDRDGNYSMYSTGLTNESYLRGVQVTDANGVVTFQTIVPGCYAGRYPHVHFEVYPNAAAATTAANKIKTSQFTIHPVLLSEVYATDGYTSSAANFRQITIATDNVFGDDLAVHQIATVTSTATSGYKATLQIGIAA